MIEHGTVRMTPFLGSQMACVWCYKHTMACMRGHRRRDQSLTMESHCEDNMIVLNGSIFELISWHRVDWRGKPSNRQSLSGVLCVV